MPQPVTRPRDPAQTRGRVHTIHYELSYIQDGTLDPAAPVVVILHDFPGDAETMRPLLGATGATPALAFDLLGYGQSSRPWPADLSVWGHADALNLALRSLGTRQVTLVGLGLGGGIAQVLATRLAPELMQRLVLIDSIAFDYSNSPNWPLPEMEKRRDPEAPMRAHVADVIADLRATIPQGSAAPAPFPAATLDALVAPYDSEVGKELLYLQIRGLVPSYMNAVAADLATLACPTLIIWGQRDTVVPLAWGQRLQRVIPGSRLEVIPDAGHLIMNDAPQAVARLVGDFVAGR